MQLKSIQYVEVQGKLRTLHPGDWWDFGQQKNQRLIASGEAWRPISEFSTPAGAGVVARGGIVQTEIAGALPVVVGKDYLPFPFTLVWDTSLRLRPELLPVGFGLLKNWQMAAPLWSYEQLACHIGDEGDRARTEAVVRDLRVPVYDARMVFFRRCAETREFARRWAEERELGDGRLAFLRVYYEIKPTLCALPVSWAGPG